MIIFTFAGKGEIDKDNTWDSGLSSKLDTSVDISIMIDDNFKFEYGIHPTNLLHKNNIRTTTGYIIANSIAQAELLLKEFDHTFIKRAII